MCVQGWHGDILYVKWVFVMQGFSPRRTTIRY